MKVLWIILAYMAGTGLSTLFIWIFTDWIFGVQKWMEDNRDNGLALLFWIAVVALCMMILLPSTLAGGVMAWLLLT